ncbi:MAG: aldo/keto reductase [Gemmatimonadota bacterium]
MISRREWLGTSLGAGAALALSPSLLRALEGTDLLQPGKKLLQRAIPSTGEMVPVISFAPRPTAPPAPGAFKPMPTDVPAAKEVLKAFSDNGGKVVDVLHGGPIGENAARTAAQELGMQDKFFWTTPLSVSIPVLPGWSGPPPKPDPAAVRAAMEEKFAALKVSKIDLVMVGTGSHIPTHLAVLREMKKEGKVRYIGVHHLALPRNVPQPPFGQLEAIMRNETIDFIGTDYSVGDRRLEETILPLALERKIGVMAYFPFDRARFFNRAKEMPLPAWAAEFDAKTWAQFSIKYVLSHPAVTMARTGTTKAEHMLDNIGGGMGRMPDEAMRKRMAAFVDALPPTPAPVPQQMPAPQQQGQPGQQAPQGPPPVVLSAAVLDRYVGEYNYVAVGQTVTVRRDGDRLFMKIAGSAPEAVLVPRSEQRFQGPFGLVFEFKPDAQGNAPAAIVEQGPNRIPLVRK